MARVRRALCATALLGALLALPAAAADDLPDEYVPEVGEMFPCPPPDPLEPFEPEEEPCGECAVGVEYLVSNPYGMAMGCKPM